MIRYRPTLIFVATVIAIGLAVIFTCFDDPAGTLASNWYITPIAIIAAAFANATAVGGGFLFVPVFVFGVGLSATTALKLSLATQAFGMTSGAIGWSRSYLVMPALLQSVVAGGIGMWLGTFVWVPENHLIKFAFAVVSIFIGIAVILEIQFGNRSHGERIENASVPQTGFYLLLCLLGGLVTAWVSIGIGEVVALYLLFVYRLRIESAIATGVAALAACSVIGLAMHGWIGGIPWTYVAFTVPGVIIGGRYGARLGRWVESNVFQKARDSNGSPLKWTFAIVVLLDGVVMLWNVLR